jgi:hypothetical protein
LRPIKCLLTRSNDSGLSWSPFREISFKYHKAAVVTGPMLKLKSGNLFLAYENFKQWDEADGNYSSAGVLSEDNGASWSWPITFASDPFARQYYWDNKLTVNPATGDLLAALWTVTNTYENKSIHLVRATPDATQWTSPSPIGIVGKSAAPLYLDAKTVLLVYVDPSGDGAIKAVLSSDAGRTWHTDDACAIYQAPARAAAQKDFYSAAFGGPDLVRCGDDILVLYYAGSENQLSICSARIKI